MATVIQPQQMSYSPWFLGAPVSKVITLTSIVSFVVCEMFHLHQYYTLDMDRLLNENEVWRLFTCQLNFFTIGEVIFGFFLLIPLMRRFEREMGSRRFGAFIFFVMIISTAWELLISQLFYNHVRSSGPYHIIGSCLLLFHLFTPRLYPKFFGILRFDFSEKSLTYGLALQVVLSGGYSTIIPVICGFISGFLCVTQALPISKWELPQFIYNISYFFCAGLVDHPPVSIRRRMVGHPATHQQQNFLNQRPPPRPVPVAPSEETIESLTSMGFQREAVIRVLQQSGNNVEVAANRLLTE